MLFSGKDEINEAASRQKYPVFIWTAELELEFLFAVATEFCPDLLQALHPVSNITV